MLFLDRIFVNNKGKEMQVCEWKTGDRKGRHYISIDLMLGKCGDHTSPQVLKGAAQASLGVPCGHQAKRICRPSCQHMLFYAVRWSVCVVADVSYKMYRARLTEIR